MRVFDTRSVPGGRTAPIADTTAAEAMVRSGDAPLALIVPRGFGSSPIRFGPSNRGPTLTVLADTSDPIAPQVFYGLLQKVAMTSMPDVMAETGIEQMDRWGGGLTAEQKATLQKNVDRLRQETRRTGPAAGGTGSDSNGGLVAVKVRDVLGEQKKNPTVAVFAEARSSRRSRAGRSTGSSRPA